MGIGHWFPNDSLYISGLSSLEGPTYVSRSPCGFWKPSNTRFGGCFVISRPRPHFRSHLVDGARHGIDEARVFVRARLESRIDVFVPKVGPRHSALKGCRNRHDPRVHEPGDCSSLLAEFTKIPRAAVGRRIHRDIDVQPALDFACDSGARFRKTEVRITAPNVLRRSGWVESSVRRRGDYVRQICTNRVLVPQLPSEAANQQVDIAALSKPLRLLETLSSRFGGYFSSDNWC